MGNILSNLKTSSPSTSNTTPEKMAEKQGFKHYSKAQSSFKPPLIANENAFLGDVYSRYRSLSHHQHTNNPPLLSLNADAMNSDKNDPDKPISCGFYRLEAGTPLVYTYTYHEMKIIVEGEFDISDETGQEVHAVAGDVFYFPKGAVITFKTNTYGLAFYTGQRKEGGG
jgi:uncharacterized cupin superfamily protein